MKIKLHIHYITRFGENLFVKIGNKEFAMKYADSGLWTVEIFEIGKSAIKYFYFVKDEKGNEIASEWRKNHILKINSSTEI
ncbi:MAG: hypothetical protein LBF04_04310, partial [Prevotellaceae bacterium]|nr:hypothetical protein [Prevotellaceae bacterium]